MQNSLENQTIFPTSLENEPADRLFQALNQTCNKSYIRPQINFVLLIINSMVMLVVYLSLKQINLFSIDWQITNQFIPLAILAVIIIILFQLIVAIIYSKQIFLKGQFLIYRHILLPLGIYSLLICTQSTIIIGIINIIAIVFSILTVIILHYLIGRESFSPKLLIDQGMPTGFHLLLFDLSLFLYSSNTNKYKQLSIVCMIMTVVYTKFVIIDSSVRRFKCLQYTCYRIQSCFNLLYTAFIIANQLSSLDPKQKQTFVYIFPLLIYCIAAEFLGEYSTHMKPVDKTFFNSFNNINRFLQTTQEIIDDIQRLNQNENQDISQTCLIPIYYMHARYCKSSCCSLSHDLQSQVLNFKNNYKVFCSAVCKILQALFLNYLQIYFENIELRIALLSFYARIAPNKTKIIQIIAQTESMTCSWAQKFRLYYFKKFATDINSGEFLQNRRIQDSFQNFSYSLSGLMKNLSQFWTQLLQQRVDFQKMLQLTQKITPVMRSVQTQVQQALQSQTFNTIRILKTYSEYSRWIVNDQTKSAMIYDYINLLSKKMSAVHQINYVTADMQIGLIAISLNVKKLGQIKLANSQAANIFNYSKQEFMSKSVDSIMPSIIAQHHDKFLRAFLENEKKKVNTDRRLLLGKKKQNHLFEIYLQLQKSIITASQQLIFIANIQIAKTQQALLILTCDDRGMISDTNSTFYEIFQKSFRKHHKKQQKGSPHFTNIQELIPSFFQLVLDQAMQIKQSSQCFDNPIFGIIQIKFQIVKLSFGQAPDMGYIIKGRRINDLKKPFFNNISLSSSLQELADDRQLKGMKLQYLTSGNEYFFNQNLDLFSCGEFQSQCTIPYLKLQFFNQVLNTNYQNKNNTHYDAQIKTIIFYGDHFERVQQYESFSSHESQQERATASNNSVNLIKEDLKKKQKSLTRKIPQIITSSYSVATILLLVAFYLVVSYTKQKQFKEAFQRSQAYMFRSKLSQYIFYFQALNDPNFGNFFDSKKSSLKSQLIVQINKANLPQLQKQKALKIVYLQQQLQNQTLFTLVNDQTLLLSSQTLNSTLAPYMTSFKAILGIFLIIKMIISLIIMQWHQQKILSIFSLFLIIPQKVVKKSHEKCLQFLKEDGQQKTIFSKQQSGENDDQNPHVKIKRFKNIALGLSSFNFLKLNAFTFIFFAFFISMLINDSNLSNSVELDKQKFSFVSTVLPEYSMKIMKTYVQTKYEKKINVTQNFKQKYQAFDYQLVILLNEPDIDNSFFMSKMLSNQCQNQSYELPPGITCQQFCDQVMNDGISKAINYLALKIDNLNSFHMNNTLEEVSKLSILLYYLVEPKLLQIMQQIKSELLIQKTTFQTSILIYFILLLIATLGDSIYQLSFPLAQIEKNIQDSDTLVKLIPEAKKKTKGQYTQI